MTLLTRLGFILAIAGGLLAVSPPLAEAYVLVKLLCLAAGGALMWAGLLRRPLSRTALDRPLLALWAVMLLSAAVSVDPPASVLGMYPQPFYGLLPLALCTALYYAAAAAAVDAAASDMMLDWMLAAAIPLSAFGISQKLFGDLLTAVPLPTGRITSTIGSPIMLGACLVLLAPLALHRLLVKKGPLALAAAPLIAAALVLTWARGAWLGAALAAALYLRLTGRLRARGRHVLVALLLLAPLLAALQRGLQKKGSDAMRVEMLKSSLPAIRARPVLGSGPDTYLMALRRYKTDEFVRLTHSSRVVQYSAHNDLLQVAVTLGLGGLLAYAWLLWALGARLFGLLRSDPADGRAAAIAAGLFGLFVQAKVNPIPPSALALAAILAGLVLRDKASPPSGASRAAAAFAAALCLACALVLARFCAADYFFRIGRGIVNTVALAEPSFMAGVNQLRRAAELDPWVLDYRTQRCDVIFRVAPFTPPEQGRQLSEKALQLTEEGVRLHPGNPAAHELRATALALTVRHGGDRLAEALAEVKTASTLDPTFVFTLRWRMDIARALRDRTEFEAARADYLRVIALTGDAPNWTPVLPPTGRP